MDPQLQALFGNADNYSSLQPGEWNPSSQDSTNIGQIIADGVKGTVDKLINAAVGEKFQSGQLTATSTQPVSRQGNLMNLLLVGGFIYLLVR